MQTFLAWGLFVVSVHVTAQPFSWRRYTPIDGLPQSQVLSLAEDQLGYLWIGTWGGGLARFDGRSFTCYTEEEGIQNNIVSKLFVDSRQNVWCATSKGLSRFDRQRFTNFGGLVNRTFQMVEYRDTLYFLNEANKLTAIVNDAVIENPRISLSGEMSYARLVSGTTKAFYLLSRSGKLFLHDQNGTLPVYLAGVDSIYNLLCRGDDLWIAAANGLFSLNPGTGVKKVTSEIRSPVLLADERMNAFWITTPDNKLVRVKVLDEKVHVGDTLNPGAMVFTGLIDREGNTWFGSNGKGLIRYYQKEFQPAEKMNDAVLSITEVKGRIWVGTMNRGIQVFENDRLTNSISFENRGDNGVNAIRHDRSGNIWFSGFTGLGRLNPESLQVTWYTTSEGLSSNYINAIDVDASDNIWISYRDKGVGKFDGKSFQQFTTRDGLSSDITFGVKPITYGRRVLVCTYNGLDQIEGEKVSRINLPEFDHASVYCADEFAGHYVVVGSADRGICICDLEGSARKCFSKKDGLLSGLIYFVTTDEQGYLWVGSDHGIERIKVNQDLEMEEHLYFSDANGLAEPEANLNAFLFSQGKKYFGLIDGLYRYEGAGGAAGNDFDVHFTRVELPGGGDLEGYSEKLSGLFRVPDNPRLPHDLNAITFRFSKVSKRFPEAVEYKFKLEGFDEKWTSQTMREVSYKNLPPGSYRFLLVARGNDGKWPVNPLAYAFTIQPPFYRNGIFIFTALIVSGAGVAGFVRHRIIRKTRMEIEREAIRQQENTRLRNEIARDFHDEMGNQLARIINYVGWLKINEARKAEALDGMEESAKSLIGGTRDFIWALDPSNDHLSSLFLHIRDFGEKLFPGKNIRFNAVNEITENAALPFGYGRQINLIFKEAMTNAFKYSMASEVNLTFSGHRNFLSVSLTDNGVGIPREDLQKAGGGISNMYGRSRRIAGELLISSPPGQGTKIKLNINLKEKNHELLDQKKGNYHRG